MSRDARRVRLVPLLTPVAVPGARAPPVRIPIVAPPRPEPPLRSGPSSAAEVRVLHRFDRSAPPRRPLPLVAAVLLLAAAACGGGTDGVTDPGAVASIQFAADADTVVAGSSVSLSGLLRDTQGNQVTATTVSWSSTNASVATVSSVGLAQGLEPGVTTIRAASGASQATLRLVVEAYVPPPPGQPSAVAPPPLASSGGDGNFTIRVVWPDGADARASALVDAAIARWRRVVTGDLPNATFDIAAGACFDGQTASR